MTRPARTAAHSRFGARMSATMGKRGINSEQLARRIGVSATQVRYWRAGHYIPPSDRAEAICDALDDPYLFVLINEARRHRCPYCGTTFDRRQKSKAIYCSIRCQVKANYKTATKVEPNPQQDAIDTFCGECEPEGICRDAECALRPFSPLLLAARRVA